MENMGGACARLDKTSSRVGHIEQPSQEGNRKCEVFPAHEIFESEGKVTRAVQAYEDELEIPKEEELNNSLASKLVIDIAKRIKCAQGEKSEVFERLQNLLAIKETTEEGKQRNDRLQAVLRHRIEDLSINISRWQQVEISLSRALVRLLTIEQEERLRRTSNGPYTEERRASLVAYNRVTTSPALAMEDKRRLKKRGHRRISSVPAMVSEQGNDAILYF